MHTFTAANCGFELLPHLSYSPDLVLFPKFKSHQSNYHFENNDEVICVVEEFLEDQMAPSSMIALQCLSIAGPSALISRGAIWKNIFLKISNSFWVQLRIFWMTLASFKSQLFYHLLALLSLVIMLIYFSDDFQCCWYHITQYNLLHVSIRHMLNL